MKHERPTREDGAPAACADGIEPSARWMLGAHAVWKGCGVEPRSPRHLAMASEVGREAQHGVADYLHRLSPYLEQSYSGIGRFQAVPKYSALAPVNQ